MVRGVSNLKKGARQVLDRYLESPAPDLLLLLLESGTVLKTEKTLPDKCAVVEFRRLSRDELQKWVQQHVTGVLNMTISQSGATLLLGAVGDDLAQLASELDKLASHSRDGHIELDAVEDLVGVRRGETMADLLDAVAARDARRSLALLRHVLEQPRTTGVSIVLALTTQMLALSYARALLDEGESLQRVEKALFSFLSAGKGAITARPWGEAIRSWMRHVSSWRAIELEAACDALLLTDMGLKETRSSSDEQLMGSLVLQLCARGKAIAESTKREGR